MGFACWRCTNWRWPATAVVVSGVADDNDDDDDDVMDMDADEVELM